MKLLDKYREFKESHPFWRGVLNKYTVATLIFAAILCFDRNNIGQAYKCIRTIRAQKAQVNYYNRAIESTSGKINAIRSDKDTLERFARENYYFHKDGETVYLIEKEK
ncbi:MAG: septum formation initiator family protein [Bacteroidales bacterium]|nr:septum formation initiator family protein [Bacteroidales bacterium]